MTQAVHTAVDAYFDELLVRPDDALNAALERQSSEGLPAIAVAPNQGKLIHLFARMSGTKRILEIGTLGGYSTIWLARALPVDGRLVTLELDPHHADVARGNLDAAGLEDRVQIMVGPAADSLQTLINAGEPPFDFIFIDADKPSTAIYLEASLRLARPGTVIVIDNVVRNGKVVDPGSTDPNVIGVRKGIEAVAANPRLSATGVQTVGSKGLDGFVLLIVEE
jgi:predicted O-methyltransferase YrrM